MSDQEHQPKPADPSPASSTSEGPNKSVRLDAQLLRALAHPMRNRILGLLRLYGPATATTLADRLAVNTGATSYHLRQLAEAGLVVEDDSRGNARDRWWKSAHQGTDFDTSELLAEEPELALGFLHGIGQIYAENMFRAIDNLQTMTPEWREASLISDYLFQLRPDELTAMTTEIKAVLEKYSTDLTAPLPDGAEQVSVQIQAYPRETR
ncbi:helix-turn-helix protein [Kribbella orskensis]|uniref:Helix-turn-helix protein n=1 Tax=Kribbella orskensis TaxID=2512216 RepID=A0ABY2B793_9ACTN|nr:MULTISPECIES: helix-turn-helix domain-containing protein [Kribbella]TCN29974.1 helix-turn-helix protein [Kribbella sp. VKM Ac-2500]TCO10114.1 helix-turn-helix protein [Kribbella orskensis]